MRAQRMRRGGWQLDIRFFASLHVRQRLHICFLFASWLQFPGSKLDNGKGAGAKPTP